MRRRNRILPLMALSLMALAALTCNRSTRIEPTLVPTIDFPSAGTAATITQSLPFTAAPEPTPTVGPSATPTLSPTPTASATPTLSPTPTATATPTPLPMVRIEEAEGALHNGDYTAARRVFEALSVERLVESEAALTRLGLAQSLLEEEDYAGAAKALRGFLAEHTDHPLVADARFLLAEALTGEGEYLDAIDEYRAYLAQRDVIAAYVQMWIGDAYTSAGIYDEAVDAYEEALAGAATLNLTFQIREKMGLALGYGGDYAGALRQYDAILRAAEDSGLRARIQYQAAQTLLVAGNSEAAYGRLYNLINVYYKTPAAYDALVDLLNSGQPVDDFQRGLVDYYSDAYDAAVAAFYSAIEADPDGHRGVLHYYAGLAYRDAGNYAAAVVEFDKLIDTHPRDPYVDDALLAKAWTQYLANDPGAAVETYTDFVAEYPTHGLAPEALWWAANIGYWDDDFERAEPLFAQLAADYSTSEYAADALYRAGLCRYRLEDYLEAEEAWRRHTIRYPTSELAIGADFWRGRALLAAGETVSATSAFSQAVSAGPLDYYSQRALDYLAGLDPGRPPTSGAGANGDTGGGPREPFLRRSFDLPPTESEEALERAATDVWLADWLGLGKTEAVTISQLSDRLASDPRLLRGQELWQLGHKAEAKEELEWLRVDTATDVRDQYQLAVFFRDLGLYRSSILAANAAIRLSPARSPFDAPPFLARLAYPIYYADLVLREAETKDLDPLLIFSLIHQESLFEGFATSFAAARGLMQIIPSTGQGIANSLGWPDYETSDLYRPFISVKFGSWYLDRQRDTFDGLIYPALAAYNGGPGNARRWLRRALVCPEEVEAEEAASDACDLDYDLFVEIIDLRETRLYVRRIYTHYAVYQHLYGAD